MQTLDVASGLSSVSENRKNNQRNLHYKNNI